MNGDKQRFMDEQSLDKLTEKITGCAYQVNNTLGIGFVEKFMKMLMHMRCARVA